MKLSFVPTIGQKLYYIGDAEDEDAPLLQLTFVNEFNEKLPAEKKIDIARKTLEFATSLILQEGITV